MTFVRPHVTVLVGVALGLVALLFHIIGLSAPGWYSVRLGEKGEATVGLWQYCHDQPKYDCEDVDKQWTVEGVCVCVCWGVGVCVGGWGSVCVCVCV